MKRTIGGDVEALAGGGEALGGALPEAARRPLRELMDDRLLDALLERSRDEAGGLRLTGEGSMLGELVRAVLERALESELTAHLGPWHQDQPYYNVDGHGVSAWIAVDPVPAGGSLELVAGSHRGPWLMPRTFRTKQPRWFPEGSLAELPDIDADPGAFDIRRFALQPGDAIFFDFLTVHGAPGFPYPSRRRVLSLRYLAADVRHAPRPWRTSPPFDGLDPSLPAGAAMDHPLFPVVWPPLR